ncbi:MAG: DUF3820 family protein [Prosthecobacter sp.]|nr:DUF3820 family protein [Prosthecobacter sp.]
MPFGKHQGKRLEDVPASYLLWLWDDGWWQRTSEPLGAYLRDALSTLQQECRDHIIQHQP